MVMENKDIFKLAEGTAPKKKTTKWKSYGNKKLIQCILLADVQSAIIILLMLRILNAYIDNITPTRIWKGVSAIIKSGRYIQEHDILESE